METNKKKSIQLESLAIVSADFLDTIEKNQREILDILKSGQKTQLENLEYVTERQAMEIIGKKATWFWQMRKAGLLSFTKVGAKVYYSLDEIRKLLASGSGKIK